MEMVGTPYYMAPEQIRDSSTVDHRVDIYAVGVILYRAFTGRLPFEGKSYRELVPRILVDPIPLPSSLGSRISAPLEELIMKALSRDPSDPFGDATEMADAWRYLKIQPTKLQVMRVG